ncbi:MAG: hypothetical protein JWN88_1463, partial [Frankiales bacterium]|nr:hypothetical protein [Frankiales bacterium]
MRASQLPDAGDGLDLRLAAPALGTWLVAWQGRLLPPGVLLGLAAAALLAAVAVLCLGRSRPARGRPGRRGLAWVVAATLGCVSASA